LSLACAGKSARRTLKDVCYLLTDNDGVALASLRDLDNLLGDPLGYWIGSVDQIEGLQAMLVSGDHPVDFVLIERRMLQQTVNGHGSPLLDA
jgi:hypothetical protein